MDFEKLEMCTAISSDPTASFSIASTPASMHFNVPFHTLLILSQPCFSYAVKINAESCFNALLEAYGEVIFEGPGGGDYYASFCLNTLKLASVFAAEQAYCQVPSLDAVVGTAKSFCSEAGLGTEATPLIVEAAKNVTNNFIARLPVVERGHYQLTENVSKPFVIDKPWFDIEYRTAVSVFRIRPYCDLMVLNSFLNGLGIVYEM